MKRREGQDLVEVASVSTKSPGSRGQHKQPEVWQKHLKVLAAAKGCSDGCHILSEPLLYQANIEA